MPPHSASHHPLKIVPKELVFQAPLNRVVTNILKLHNVSQSPLAYKVKTTAPQRYCVRPNNGVLPPGETIEVQVLLNYVKDAPPNLDTKDKFQIQSILLAGPLSNVTDIGEVWSKATPEQITKQKLKARFTAAQTKPANPSISASNSSSNLLGNGNNGTQSEQGTNESTSHNATTTTTITTTTTHQSPQSDIPLTSSQTTLPTPAVIPTVSPLSSSQQSAPLQSQPAPQTSSQTTPISSPSLPSPLQASQQTHSPTVDKKESLGDSAESQSQYFTPTITALNTQKANIPQTSLSTSQTKVEPAHVEVHHSTPTGDSVVDAVANHSQLRKTLEQVATLKAEREGVLKDNQKLSDQVKLLTDLLQRAKEEHQTGLRQRTQRTPGGPSTDQPSTISAQQQMHVQIQTRTLLIIILVFILFGFALGRLTR